MGELGLMVVQRNWTGIGERGLQVAGRNLGRRNRERCLDGTAGRGRAMGVGGLGFLPSTEIF